MRCLASRLRAKASRCARVALAVESVAVARSSLRAGVSRASYGAREQPNPSDARASRRLRVPWHAMTRPDARRDRARGGVVRVAPVSRCARCACCRARRVVLRRGVAACRVALTVALRVARTTASEFIGGVYKLEQQVAYACIRSCIRPLPGPPTRSHARIPGAHARARLARDRRRGRRAWRRYAGRGRPTRGGGSAASRTMT